MSNTENSDQASDQSKPELADGASDEAYQQLPEEDDVLRIEKPTRELVGLIALVILREDDSIENAEILERAMREYVDRHGYLD